MYTLQREIYWVKKVADYSIVLVNYFIRILVIFLTERIGYDNRTEETSKTILFIFIL